MPSSLIPLSLPRKGTVKAGPLQGWGHRPAGGAQNRRALLLSGLGAGGEVREDKHGVVGRSGEI